MTDHDKAIEAAAIGIVNGDWEELPELHKVLALAQARLAIAAYLAAMEAEGFVMVPTDDKVTDAMVDVGISALERGEDAPAVIFAEMASARPNVKG